MISAVATGLRRPVLTLPCMSGRVIRQEWLDDVPASEARASLGDLVRINRLLGGHQVLRETLAGLVKRTDSFSLLDVGAASGDMGRVIRENYAAAAVTAFDYKLDHLANAVDPRVCGDAFRMPFARRSFDYVFCSLFLHHFQNDQVVSLLRSFAELARRGVIVTDLERNVLAYYFLPATKWLFGWDRITLHDGPISVEAAFRARELSGLAERAGLHVVRVRAHRPAFRLSLIAEPTG